MNEKSLEKNLANLERELLALQTAHDVGLGAVGFYEYQGEGDTFDFQGINDQMFILLMDVDDGERLDPLLNVFVSSIYGNNQAGFAYVERYNSAKFDVFILRPFTQETFHLQYKIISSSRLRVKVAESWEEYEEWLDGGES